MTRLSRFGRLEGASQAPVAPIRVLFVANRGEIAARITRTAEHLGIRPVVPSTEGPGAVDLLSIEAVVGAARAAGADAVHPGFGFLAENADFAEAVIAAGLRWVGPPPSAIRAMGDKAAARRLAARPRDPDRPRLRRPGPGRRDPGARRGRDRPPVARQAGCRRRRQGDARRADRREPDRRVRDGPSRGGRGIR